MRRTDRAAILSMMLAFATTSSLAALVTSPARAWCRLTTSNREPTAAMPCVRDGNPLAWRRRCVSYAIYATRESSTGALRATSPLELPAVRSIVADAFDKWASLACGGTSPTFQIRELDTASRCNDAVYNVSGGNISTIAFVDDWAARGHSGAAYALTTVWHSKSTGEILDADMEINELRGPYTECPHDGCRDGSADLSNVLTHEAGHFFGMAHATGTDATMYPMAAQGETSKRTLASDDADGFCAAYPAGSLPSACDDTPTGGLLLECRPSSSCSAASGSDAPGWLAMSGVLLAFFFRRRRA